MKKLLFLILISFFSISAYSQCGLVANFNYSSIGCRKLQFIDSSYTTNSDYTIIKSKWYFGDGDTASAPSIPHYYDNTITSQNLFVKLVVTAEDAFGHTCTDSILVQI